MLPHPSDTRRRAPARLVLIALSALASSVLASGCASNKSVAYSQVGARAAVPAPVPVKTEVEDDGVPVQSPPLRRKTTEKDDPSEPYSPNYGSRRPSPPAKSAAIGAPVPRATTVGYDSTFDPNGVIAKAIAAHEVRVQ